MPNSFIEQARRKQIIDAAIEVIAEHGYVRASFVRIGKQAGVSPALISYHFRDKAHLVEQLIGRITSDMDRALTSEISEAPNYSVALRRLICAQVDYFKVHLTEVVALSQIFEYGLSDPTMSPGLVAMRATWANDLERLLREGQASGDFADFDVRPVALSLVAAQEAFVTELHDNPDTDAEAYGSTLARLFDAATRADRRLTDD